MGFATGGWSISGQYNSSICTTICAQYCTRPNSPLPRFISISLNRRKDVRRGPLSRYSWKIVIASSFDVFLMQQIWESCQQSEHHVSVMVSKIDIIKKSGEFCQRLRSRCLHLAVGVAQHPSQVPYVHKGLRLREIMLRDHLYCDSNAPGH